MDRLRAYHINEVSQRKINIIRYHLYMGAKNDTNEIYAYKTETYSQI